MTLGFPFRLFKHGRCSSSAIAYRSLGALAKLYSPAPVDDNIIPMATSQ